jgi:hypothetical protein
VDVRQAMAQRDSGGPAAQAFISLLRKLKQVLRALAVVRTLAAEPHFARVEFRLRLPGEAGDGAPPARKLRAFALEQARPLLAWCRAHAAGYSSPFLDAPSFRFPSGTDFKPGEWRNLGQVLKAMSLDTDEALAAYVRGREKKR